MTNVDVGDFKRAAGKFASGVTIVTSRKGNQVYGITVSAFASLSVEPLQVLVSVRNGNPLRDMIMDAGVFAVSVLREEQRDVSRHFAVAGREPCEEDFLEVRCTFAVTGAPVVEGCLAYFDCRLASAYPGGDHTIFVGDVLAASADEGAPLLYYNGDYRGVRELETARA